MSLFPIPQALLLIGFNPVLPHLFDDLPSFVRSFSLGRESGLLLEAFSFSLLSH